jgi:hypothetical protein
VEPITRNNFLTGCRVLIDNGIPTYEAQNVMQALCHAMHDKETEHFMVDEVPHCDNCVYLDLTCVGDYACGDTLPNFLEAPK